MKEKLFGISGPYIDYKCLLIGQAELPLGEKQRKHLEKITRKIKEVYGEIHRIAIPNQEPYISGAGIIKRELRDIEIVKDRGLREIDLGLLNGMDKKEALEKHPNYFIEPWKNIDKRFPRGESLREAITRISNTTRRIIEKYHDERVLFLLGDLGVKSSIGMLNNYDPREILGLRIEKHKILELNGNRFIRMIDLKDIKIKNHYTIIESSKNLLL